jgi:hypothetical protein
MNQLFPDTQVLSVPYSFYYIYIALIEREKGRHRLRS